MAVGIFLLSVGVIVFRQPTLFIEPRLWAEEGGRFFSYAFSHSWLQSLLQTQGGYYTLWPNIAATIAANCVPLSHAPLVTTVAAFIVQIIPIAIILWSNSPLWETENIYSHFIKKTVAISIIILVPSSDEAWLNTICSQFYFSLISLFILTENENLTRLKNWLYRFLLLISGLTGVLSCLLTPLFFIKWFMKREKESLIRFSILATCLAIQMVVAIKFPHTNAVANKSRFVPLDYSLFASIAFTHTISPIFLGFDNTLLISNMLSSVRSSLSIFRYLGNVLLLLEIFFFCFLLSATRYREYVYYLLGSYLFIFLTSAALSVGDKFDQVYQMANTRYYFIPTAIVMLLLLFNIHFKKDLPSILRSSFITLLLGISLFFSFQEFHQSNSYFSNINEYKSINWKHEISQWEKDNNYTINIWPTGWKMNLAR